jgi:hypothetical protein
MAHCKLEQGTVRRLMPYRLGSLHGVTGRHVVGGGLPRVTRATGGHVSGATMAAVWLPGDWCTEARDDVFDPYLVVL